jgi:septum formation protein
LNISNSDRLLLASASPRRAELLAAAGIAFDVSPADVDEAVRDGERPDRYVVRVAIDKARLVSARFPDRLVLGADTTVVVDDRMLAKPADAADAARMLRVLSGRWHVVLTGIAIARGGAVLMSDVAATRVEFASIRSDEIDWYVATGEPMDKAGAYAIQGLASRFVTAIQGSYSNVVGLPVSLVYAMLNRAARMT